MFVAKFEASDAD